MHVRIPPRLIKLFIAVLFIFLLISILFIIPSFLTIKTVYITAYADIFPEITYFKQQRNILFFSAQRMRAEMMKKFPLVADVSFERRFPDTLNIFVTERSPVARLNTTEEPLFIDKDGVIILPTARMKKIHTPLLVCNVEKIETGALITNPAILSGIHFLEALIPEDRVRIDDFNCQNEHKLEFHIADLKIYFDTGKNFTTLASSLHFLFNQFRIEGQRPKAVDLRFEKPVIIFNDEYEASPSTLVTP